MNSNLEQEIVTLLQKLLDKKISVKSLSDTWLITNQTATGSTNISLKKLASNSDKRNTSKFR